MFLKRSLILAAGFLLFLVGFIGFFQFRDMRMEDAFRQARRANGVDNGVLTTHIASSTAPGPVSATPSSPAPAPAVEVPVVSPPASSMDTNTTATASPSPAATGTTAPAVDTNVIIGPLPPSGMPETGPAPSSSAPSDTNPAGPMGSPPSTMLDPGVNHLALFVLSACTPLLAGSTQVQAMPSAPPTVSAPAPAPTPGANPASASADVPATNAPAATSPVTAASTAGNAVTSGSGSETARPVPVEASVIVLLYHQFVPAGVHIAPKLQWTMNEDVFESEMKYVHDNGYHVIPMSDLQKFLKHEIGLPPNSVVITIDDGYKSAIVYAAPILKKYGFPWTFFVYPDFITTAESKGAASWNDLLALQADGVDIECHSMSHPQMTRHYQKVNGSMHNLSPDEYDAWLATETAGAKALLEQKLGKPVTCFAYPYGDYNKTVEAKAIAAGFEDIFTVADNPVHSTTDPYSVGRYTITQSVVKSFTAYLRQGALGLSNVDPAPGAIITNPRPVITAVLGYAGTIDPKSIETQVRDFGEVRHDFDPKTSTLRLYLPRDLVQPMNLVNIRAKDAQTGQVIVANWHFNYQPPAAAPVHPPLDSTAPATNSVPAAVGPATPASTNASPAVASSTTASAAVPATNRADPPRTSSKAP